MGLLILRSSVAISQPLTGISWDGTAGGTGNYANASLKRGWYILNPPAMRPFTLIRAVYPRSQVGTTQRFCTDFFYGNHGDFDFASPTGYARAYVGAHPYPDPNFPDPQGEGKWELAYGTAGGVAHDLTTRDDSSSPYITFDQWYDQALRLQTIGGGEPYEARFYVDLAAGMGAAHRITGTRSSTDVTPPTPSLMFGQTGLRQTSPSYDIASWGNQIRGEETNAIHRKYQIFSVAVADADIATLRTCERDDEAKSAASGLGLTHWYLNMNPTPSDVTDKSGNGNHGTWDSADRPTLWQEAV